jgi:hypothetical protein
VSSRLLPVGKPPLIGYLHHAYPLAVLSQTSRYLPWFYSHYIQVHCPVDLAEGPDPARKRKFNFYRPPGSDTTPCQGLSVTPYPREIFLVRGQIVEFIRHAILQGRFVQVCVDEGKIPGKAAFGKRRLLHELFVYGFDDQSRLLHTLGFQATGDFGSSAVSYGDLQRGFLAGARNNDYDPVGIHLLILSRDASWHFDLEVLLLGLEDYVYGKNTSERFRFLSPPISGVFGWQTYGCLIDLCANLLAHPGWFDIRPMHILWEHKVCMHGRIAYLEKTGYLDPGDAFGVRYAAIENLARTARMMMLKVRVSRERDLVRRIILVLERMAREEGPLLACLLETLRLHTRVGKGDLSGS